MLLLVEEGCTRESSLETVEGSGGGRGQGLVAFFDSPDPSQGIFAAQQGEISLMQGMNQIMAPTHPAPNTTSMLSVASFPGTSIRRFGTALGMP
jgi:hypothetical protein